MQKFITKTLFALAITSLAVSATYAATSVTLCTADYAPVCGQMSLTSVDCPYGSTSCAVPEPQTYSNICMMNAAGASFLYSGECTGGMTITRPLARIETTERGVPMVGNSSELNFVCENSSYMSVTKTYNAYQGARSVYNADTAGIPVFSKIIPAELGTTYKLYCGSQDGTSESSATYITPDYLKPQIFLTSIPTATTNTGSVLYSLNLQFVNPPLKECYVFLNGTLNQTLAAGVSSANLTLQSGSNNSVYVNCKYSNNSVATGSVDSNTLSIAVSSVSPSVCPATGNFTNATCKCPNGLDPFLVPSGTRIQQYTCENPVSTNMYCSVFDVDGDGKNQALVDGVLISRALNDYVSDANLLNGITLSSNSTRTTGTAIRKYVKDNLSSYDVDGSGTTVAGTDGLLITRYMLGLTGDAMISGIPVAWGVTGDSVITNIKKACGQSSTTMCTAVYKPVCGRAKNSCDGLDPTAAMACRPAAPVYTTYSNRCELDRAGAVYVSEGACGGVATTSLDFSVSNYSMPQSQYVIADGIKDISGMINFKTSNSAAQKIIAVTVYGLRDIISASLNGTTASVIGYSATFNGLSISPNTNVLFSLKPAAISANIYDGSGTGSAMPFFKDLSFTTNDNSIQTQGLVSSMLPSYSFVAGKPVIKFENWSRAGLQNGSVKVAEISIGADSGDIKINNIPFSIRKSSPFVISGYSIVDESGTAINGVNIPAYESSVDFSFSNGGYVIQSGTTKKFSIYATVSGLSGNSSYVRFMLRDKSDNLFTWSDLVSNKNLLTASLLDYPTNTQTTTNGNVATPAACPAGTFTNADCVCPNGQGPNAVPSGTRIQMFTCGSVTATSTTPTKNYCPLNTTFDNSECTCPLGTSMQTVNISSCSSFMMCASRQAYSCVAIPNYETPPYIPEIPINSTPTVCIQPTVNVGVGSRGSAVTDVQKFLNSNGYLNNSPTGYFGSATRAAVIKFQSENGINTTGFVGQLTRAQLRTKSCEQTIPVPTPQPYTPIETSVVASSTVASVTTSQSMIPENVSSVSSIRVVSDNPGAFTINSMSVENGNAFTVNFTASSTMTFTDQYSVQVIYKDITKTCTLAAFVPIAGNPYKLSRNVSSVCKNTGLSLGNLADIGYIRIGQ